MSYYRYFLIILIALEMANASSSNRGCGLSFMYDPCAVDSYSIVETEKFIKGPHNCIAVAHYFPGEEPDDYCERGGKKGKDTTRPKSPVAPVK